MDSKKCLMELKQNEISLGSKRSNQESVRRKIMSFKYSAFTENTPEMREWLEGLGYRLSEYYSYGIGRVVPSYIAKTKER